VDVREVIAVDVDADDVPDPYQYSNHLVQASNTVSAKLRDLSKAGSVIDAAALTAGEDVRLQGVSFSIDNTSALVAKARTDAIHDALAQGKHLGQFAFAGAERRLGALAARHLEGKQRGEQRDHQRHHRRRADLPPAAGVVFGEEIAVR